MVYLTTISMYYVLYKMENSKSETESMKIKKLKMIVIHVSDVNLRAPHCLVACTPLLSCAQWLFMYACTREDWPITFILHRLNRAEITGICHGRGHNTELRNGEKRGIDQSETSSHLTHLGLY